jgi:hypothetical protein
MPRTLDDVTIQMTFSERSSRMRTGVVDGVEGSLDIKQGNPDPLDFDCPSGPRRNFLYRRDGKKIRHGADPSSWLSSEAIRTFRRLVSDLISTEAYGIERVHVPRLNPGLLIQGASVGNEGVAWK